jgi:hypothetical protein
VVSAVPQLHFTPGEITANTDGIVGWVGPRGGLNTEVTRKNLCRDQTQLSSPQSDAILTDLPQLQVHTVKTIHIISQWPYFVACSLMFPVYSVDAFGFLLPTS